MLTGENSILLRASESKEQTQIGQEKEGVGLAVTEARIGNNGYQELSLENLQNAIDSQFGSNVATVIPNGENSFIVQFDNREYEVNGKNISRVEKVIDSTPGKLAGKGTELEPYLIESIEDLVWFSKDVSTENNYSGIYVKLLHSLNFNSDSSYVNPNIENFCGYDGKLKTALTTGEGFSPIVTWYGNFDGNGKIIKNLYINQNAENELLRVGLFKLNYGTIQDLGLDGTVISVQYKSASNQNAMIGSFCGYNVNGIINNCYNYGTINLLEEETSGGHYIGGISGNNNFQIKNCYSKGNIIVNSDVTLNVNRMVGGITAQNTSNAEFENCFNLTKISGTYAYVSNTGGLVGSNKANVINSYNLGDINIKNISDKGYFFVGGIVGSSDNSTIDNCYNLGAISYEKQSENVEPRVGLICGSNATMGIIQNSKFLIDSNFEGVGVNKGTNNAVGVEKREQMPSILSIIGSSFKKDSNKINNSYPILVWQ